MAEESFDLGRLIKFMGMTQSSSEHEALVALRLANREIVKIGKSWAEILSGKVTVIADPFAGVPEPTDYNDRRRTTPPPVPDRPKAQWTPAAPPPPPPRPRPMRNQYSPPPPPPPPPKAKPQYKGPSIPSSNKFRTSCYMCHEVIPERAGFIARNTSDTAWDAWCQKCHNKKLTEALLAGL